MPRFHVLSPDMSPESGAFASLKTTDPDVYRKLLAASVDGSLKPGRSDEPYTLERTDERPAADWLLLSPGSVAFSQALRRTFDSLKGQVDRIEWLQVDVEAGQRGRLEYSVPIFDDGKEFLHAEQTQWGPSGLPIRWYLDVSKVGKREIFPLWGSSHQIIVSERVLAELTRRRFTGFVHEPARLPL